ncbi:hypothetical protein PUN4_60102 [Paraburkholderia unamae]|nr:hypothetical protein PUN4_60102 [Paraburkholderia unamae]
MYEMSCQGRVAMDVSDTVYMLAILSEALYFMRVPFCQPCAARKDHCAVPGKSPHSRSYYAGLTCINVKANVSD